MSGQIRRYSGDYGNRWYLADRPVFAGTTLEAEMANGDWVECRFEGPFATPQLYDLLSVPISAAKIMLRWPEESEQ